ncbi:hypothetical protein HAX54_014679 [Datura stramonium]|uniref:F-box domain-containing protein n=1 Tax=Datura stramonium TaxID=4076 RepID=A0ABS8TQE0_DATST|nr:hypothetical protein [Datura stramonium]
MNCKLSIPHEIIFEIFSWLPIKSLMRFKCVIKFCNSLVSGSDFSDTHRCRSSGGTKFFLHERESVFYSAEQKIEDGKDYLQIERCNSPASSWLDCVNDLFCIWGPSSAAIFNPSTREVRFLPNLSEDFSPLYYSLGFEPEENKYKVLLTTDHVQKGYRKHWVTTLGTDKSWRETKSSPRILGMPGVCINGVIYKFVRHECKTAIAAFDVKTEIFRFIALWNASDWWYYKLIEVNGQLAIIDYQIYVRGYVHLRVLEQTEEEEEEWESQIIHFPLIWKDIPEVILSCMSCDGEIFFMVNLASVKYPRSTYDEQRINRHSDRIRASTNNTKEPGSLPGSTDRDRK